MAIILPREITPQQIRVLQEFRRVNAETMSVADVLAIKHPSGGGDAPAEELVARGLLVRTDDGYALTDAARQFLAYEPKPADSTS